MAYALHPIIEVPPMLVLEAAVGVDTLDSICERFGYDQTQTAQLRNDPGFKRAVQEQEVQLRKEGVTFKMRVQKAADDLMGVVWRESKDERVPVSVKLDVLKVFAKLADYEPKTNAPVQTGSTFGIRIIIDGKNVLGAGTKTEPIDVTPTHDPLGETPTYLGGLNTDLEYTE